MIEKIIGEHLMGIDGVNMRIGRWHFFNQATGVAWTHRSWEKGNRITSEQVHMIPSNVSKTMLIQNDWKTFKNKDMYMNAVWVKQCHKPPIGMVLVYTTTLYGDAWGMGYCCLDIKKKTTHYWES